jgi:hypothetical protein
MVHEPNRRQLIAQVAGSILGVGLLPNFFSSKALATDSKKKARTKNIIYLYMDGGMSHVDTLDPKSGDVAGPTKTIKTSATGVKLGEYLPLTAKQMHHGTIIRSITSTQGAHEQGNYFMHTSFQLRGTINHPSMGPGSAISVVQEIPPCRPPFMWAIPAVILVLDFSPQSIPPSSLIILKTA